MCLTYVESYTKDIAAKLDKDGKITVYKFYVFVNGNFRSPYWYSTVDFSDGVISSNRRSTKRTRREIDAYDRAIDRGLHVFMKRQAARYYSENYDCPVFILKLEGRKEFFVAAGTYGNHESAVFTKLHVPPSEQRKIQKFLAESQEEKMENK